METNRMTIFSRKIAGRQAGFTLLELMIVVVIVGILAAITYPSYRDHVLRTKRSDAKTALTELANLQEKYYAQCYVYTDKIDLAFPVNNSDCDAAHGLGRSINSPEGYYTLSIVVGAPPTTYVLTAAAQAGKSQTDDTGCTSLQLSSTGAKAPAGCW